MEKRITVDQALEMTMNILNGINVPVAMMEQIGIPISRAVSNIAQCVDALRHPNEEPEQEPKPEPEFVDAGFEEKKEDLPQADKVIEMGRDPEDGNDCAE